MALVKGINSYQDLGDSETYFEDRVNSDWSTFGDVPKETALVTASQILDEQPWLGYTADTDQSLNWPRVLTYSDRGKGRSITLDSAVIPTEITNAVNELAHHLLSNTDVLNESGGVQSLSVSGIILSDIRSASVFSGRAFAITRKFLTNNSNSVFVGA